MEEVNGTTTHRGGGLTGGRFEGRLVVTREQIYDGEESRTQTLGDVSWFPERARLPGPPPVSASGSAPVPPACLSETTGPSAPCHR